MAIPLCKCDVPSGDLEDMLLPRPLNPAVTVQSPQLALVREPSARGNSGTLCQGRVSLTFVSTNNPSDSDRSR